MNRRRLIIFLNIFILTGSVNICLGAVNVKKEVGNLNSKKSEQKLSAIHKLGLANTKEARTALLSEMRSQKDPNIRARIFEALSQGHDSDTVKETKDVLKNDTDPKVRRAAAYSLGYANDASAVTALIETFSNKNEQVNVRNQAGSSLMSYTPTKEVYDCFLQGTEDASYIIRIKSLTALSFLYGFSDKDKIVRLLKSMLNDPDEMVKKNARSQIDSLTGVKK